MIMTTTATAAEMSRAFEQSLRHDIGGDAQRVIVGLNWTLVVGPDGAGLSHTPARGTEGCRSLPQSGTYAGRPLAELAALWGAPNVFEHAIAVAAVNAHWNRFDLEGESVNGLDLIENHGERTVMIGRFPGIAERWPGIAVVEREPRAGEFPESALPELLAKAQFVAVTASAIVNGSMPGILAMSGGAKVLVIGPSTPLAPPLFEQGIDMLSGYVARDVDGLARAISEGASVAAIRPFGRYATIRRS
jgi:uncharacterized protein (DUF4213/DUF364 family)